jgi:phage terminase large subunit
VTNGWHYAEGGKQADSSSPDAYMKRHGFPRMTEWKKGAGSVEDGIEFLQSFDIVVHPECPHTAEELANYSYKIDSKTDEVIPVLEDKNNHVIDALRYALEGTRHSTYNLDALASWWWSSFGWNFVKSR